MKKILKYISLIGLSSFILTGNVKAQVNVESKPGHRTEFGYSTQTQTYSNGSCTANLYCLDKGLANQESFKGCSAIDVTNTIAGSISGTHDQREYQYRVIFNNSGLTKADYSKYNSILNPTGIYGNLKNATVPVTSQTEGYVDYTSSSSNGFGTVNATVNLGQTGLAGRFHITSINSGKDNLKVADLKVVENGNGSYTLTITNIPIVECEGGNVEVAVDGASTTVSTNQNKVYFVDCHNGKQNYVIETNNSCNINQILERNSESVNFKFSVADDECKCSGTSNLCQACVENGESSDNQDNIKGCANKGKFEKYCDTSIKKEDDNDKGTHTNITSKTGSVKTELKNNNYCNVFCLEDIKYSLPGSIKTKSGRYFKLKKGFNLGTNEDGSNISITGTRKCVTSQIKTSQFVDDVIANEEAVKNAYNTYKHDEKYNEALEKAISFEVDAVNCTKRNAAGTCIEVKGCSYMQHKASDADRLYKKAEVSYNHSNGSVKVNQVEDSVEEITWVTDSTCDGNPNTKKPEKKTLNPAAIDAALQVMYDTINEYKSCFEWKNNYCFSPQAEFTYNEVYKDNVNGKIPMKGTVTPSDETSYYYTDVDAAYNGTPNSNTAQTYGYIYANKDLINNENYSTIDVVSKYVKKEVTASATFDDSTVDVYSYHPYGTISFDSNCVAQGKCTSLGKIIPVALQHDPESTAYEYNVKFENVGVAGDDASCKNQPNRINGTCKNGETLTEKESNCSTDYSCYYETTDCPKCEVECVCPENSKNCYVEDKVCKYKECPNCKVECIGCIVDRGNTTISYKTISLDKVYKNEENIGSNWTTEEVKEIENEGQEIYNETPQYSFNLTPQAMSKIREYNKISVTGKANADIPKGGYNNDTLTCETKDGIAKNCKSSFIRNYLEKNTKNVINGTLPDSWDNNNYSRVSK